MTNTSPDAPPGKTALIATRWNPSPAMRAAIALHIACVIALIAWPRGWPWILGALALCHLVLGAAGMWPRSRLLGPNLTRLPERAARLRQVALTFDDGPDPDVTPAVLDILDRYNAQATFFCIGDRAAAHPEIVKEILRRGHSVENHSMRHSHWFGFFSVGAMHTDIAAAQSVLQTLTGRQPAFFRAPMGLRNPFLDPVVSGLGLTHTSWTRRGFDTLRQDPAVVLKRLTRDLSAGDILLLHDRKSSHGAPIVLTVLPQLLQQLAAAGLVSVSLQAAVR